MATGTGQSEQQLAGRLEIRPEHHAALVDGRPLSLTMRVPEAQLIHTHNGIGYRFSPEG
jgi:hypothetical protein